MMAFKLKTDEEGPKDRHADGWSESIPAEGPADAKALRTNRARCLKD